MSNANGLLSGIRVLELCQAYSGPYCSMMLSFMGAEVIKVEPPSGDHVRHLAPVEGTDFSYPYLMMNSNKQGITLNLKSARGKELLGQLISKSDVVIENFATDAARKLNITYEAFQIYNPRLIMASISGFGREGAYQEYAGIDATIQALSGMMSVTGFPDSPPVKAGPAITDFLASTHAATAICAALFNRSLTGKGAYFDIAIRDGAFPTLVSSLGTYLKTGVVPQRTGNRSGMVVPFNCYCAKDGYIVIACSTDIHWQKLVEIMGRPELATASGFQTQWERAQIVDEVDRVVGEWVSGLKRSDITGQLVPLGIPCGPILTVAEVAADPDLKQRGIITEVQPRGVKQPVPVIGSVIRGPSGLNGVLSPAPSIGEHNETIYCELLGLSLDEVTELKAKGII